MQFKTIKISLTVRIPFWDYDSPLMNGHHYDTMISQNKGDKNGKTQC